MSDSQSKNADVFFHDLGLIDYEIAHNLQLELFNHTIQTKLNNRSSNTSSVTSNHLVFCEHPHVYTLGRSGKNENLLIDSDALKAKGATFFPIGRGGDITYHGPGQLVGYPIIDLENFFTDIHLYLRYLEEAVIRTLADFGISAGRIDGLTGVWIDFDKENPEGNTWNPRKICAFGVKASRWVTMHGFALNVNTDLSYFDYIVPCGIKDKAVTSIQQEVGREVAMQEVKATMKKHLAAIFNMVFVQ